MWGRISFLARVIALALVVDFANAQDSLNVRQVGLLQELWNNALSVTVTDTLAFIATSATGLQIVSVADPAHPVAIGSYDTPGSAAGVALSGNYAYVADGIRGLRVVDITDPAIPFEAGFCGTPGWACGVAVVGNYAYLASRSSGLRVVDITNPASPIEVGFYHNSPGSYWGVAVAGNYAYVAGGWVDEYGGYLRVVDISNPVTPSEVGFYETPAAGYVNNVVLSGNYAFITDASLRVADISNPASPYEAGFCGTPGYAQGVAVAGNYAYLADVGTGLRVVNVSNPTAPSEVGFYNTPGDAYCVAVLGNYAYVSDGSYFGIYDCSAATGISENFILHPSAFTLSCYPNPFNPTTTISFEVPRAERVTVNVFNITGQFVQTLVDERLTPGTHAIRFDGSNLSSGLYLYRLDAGDFSAARKMVLIK